MPPIEIGMLLSLEHIFHYIFHNYMFVSTFQYSMAFNPLWKTLLSQNLSICAIVHACTIISIPSFHVVIGIYATILSTMLYGVHTSRSHILDKFLPTYNHNFLDKDLHVFILYLIPSL